MDGDVPDGAQDEQSPTERDVRAILAERKYRSDLSIGQLPFAARIWSHALEWSSSDDSLRGRTLRAAVWELIEWHHEEALNGGEPCQTCAHIADARAWHVLWLENTFTPKEGFERRYTHEELVALGSYAACDGEVDQIEPQEAAIIRRLQREGRLEDTASYPIRLSRGLRWYGVKAGLGRRALIAHLVPDDPKLQAALARQGITVANRSEATSLPTPAITTGNDGVEYAATSEPAQPPKLSEPVETQVARQIVSPANAALEITLQPLPVSPATPLRTVLTIGPARLTRSHLIVIVSMLMLAITVSTLLVVSERLPLFVSVKLQTRPISEAQIAGFFVARQWSTGSARTLYVINAHTGEYRPLWPDAAMLEGKSSTVELADFLTDTSPAYLPARHVLAFIADKGHTPVIWLAKVEMGTDGWPRIAPPGPQALNEDCSCSAVAWSASGDWLLHDSPTGIVAVSPDNLAQQQVTNNSKDRWPACSPTGDWIAFQNALDDITALPSRDCIPIPEAAASERYLNGYRVAWRPAWSADGRMLAFVSNQGGQNRIYTVSLDHLARSVNLEDRAPTSQVSQGQCADPLWAVNQTTHERLIVFTCAPQASTPGHGSLVAVPATPTPTWQASVDQGALGRDSMCWLPG